MVRNTALTSWMEDLCSIILIFILLHGVFICLFIDLYFVYRGLKYTLQRDKYGFIFFYGTILYAIWYVIDKDSPNNGAIKYLQMRQRLPEWTTPILSYFPLKLHFTTDLSNHDRYIFGYHPHGILPLGAMSLTSTKQGFFTQMGTISIHFKIPLWRELAMLHGFVDVSRQACEIALKENGSMLIAVGGAKEAMDTFSPNHMILTIGNGLFRLAMRTGIPIVPVLAFGELDLFEPIHIKQSKWLERLQAMAYHHFGFASPLFKGKFMTILPARHPINIYIGEPIKVIQTQHPTLQQLAELRKLYIDQLHSMFDIFNSDPQLVLRIKQ